ncbi:MAG: hypothetical protein V1882_11050 [Candidatus Omnitrophota bacterium]
MRKRGVLVKPDLEKERDAKGKGSSALPYPNPEPHGIMVVPDSPEILKGVYTKLRSVVCLKQLCDAAGPSSGLGRAIEEDDASRSFRQPSRGNETFLG